MANVNAYKDVTENSLFSLLHQNPHNTEIF